MKKRIINKSIFIGLGGTGQNIIKSLKKQMIDNFGEVPSPVRLLSIDTDVQDVNKGDVELVGLYVHNAPPMGCDRSKLDKDTELILPYVPIPEPIDCDNFKLDPGTELFFDLDKESLEQDL